MSLSLDVSPITGDKDLFGKTASQLQSDIVVGDDSITGTLLYVDDYTGFSGDPSLQSGNYIALHAETNVSGATIVVTLTNPVTLDPDGDVVLRVRDKSTQTITVVASKEGYENVTKTFSLDELVVNNS